MSENLSGLYEFWSSGQVKKSSPSHSHLIEFKRGIRESEKTAGLSAQLGEFDGGPYLYFVQHLGKTRVIDLPPLGRDYGR